MSQAYPFESRVTVITKISDYAFIANESGVVYREGQEVPPPAPANARYSITLDKYNIFYNPITPYTIVNAVGDYLALLGNYGQLINGKTSNEYTNVRSVAIEGTTATIFFTQSPGPLG